MWDSSFLLNAALLVLIGVGLSILGARVKARGVNQRGGHILTVAGFLVAAGWFAAQEDFSSRSVVWAVALAGIATVVLLVARRDVQCRPDGVVEEGLFGMRSHKLRWSEIARAVEILELVSASEHGKHVLTRVAVIGTGEGEDIEATWTDSALYLGEGREPHPEAEKFIEELRRHGVAVERHKGAPLIDIAPSPVDI